MQRRIYMDVTVIGTGYVGLTTGTCFAELGMKVMCMDTDEEKILKLRNGVIPIYEPGMEEMVRSNYLNKSLGFTSDLKDAVEFSNVIFIAVGTPILNHNIPNLNYLFKAARSIAAEMNDYKVIVIKSTVPLGTCERVKKLIRETLINHKKNVDFDVVSNPEFLRQGSAIYDFMEPDRIIVGAQNPRSEQIMAKLYNYHIMKNIPFIVTDFGEAEMIKYVSNAFLATKISFINEIAIMCEAYNVDVTVVAKGVGLDKRIGSSFLNPGLGYGGSCFPKDTKALLYIGQQVGYTPKIVNEVINVNKLQANRMIKKIEAVVKNLTEKTITILGVSFKPDTDDMREAPIIPIIKYLLFKKANIKIYDPKAMENCKIIIEHANATYCTDAYAACEDSECIIVATEWNEFRGLDFVRVKDLVKVPLLIDLRNIYDPAYIKELGFSYEGVGRK
jgi:UDPglucose 6-dehydrogenase